MVLHEILGSNVRGERRPDDRPSGRVVTKFRLSCGVVLLAVLPLAGLAPAAATESQADRAQRWQDLKHAMFGDRTVVDNSGAIALEAPVRALDAALVPITVTLAADPVHSSADVKALYILVDGNPSPLVGTFRFGPDADPHLLQTRVRVDQYTLMHAVVELADGRLLATERFVKAAGGCSAPSLKDPKLALARLGRMKLRLPGGATLEENKPATVEILVSHPNANGMQVDQLTHNFIPARFIQDMKVSYAGKPVLTVEADISLSEDPAITFAFTPHGPGALGVDVKDSTSAQFHQDFPVGGGKS